jgi:2-polyprenyl-6-methoxyphenol hydroxylase-like FAD-dependent oxidoreductase
MRHITIIGAGQAGLQLALGLLRQGYEVTMVSDRTPDQIRHGWATGAATLFGRAIRLEQSLGQNDWVEAVATPEAEVALRTPDGFLSIKGTLPEPWLAVDQRLKHAHWLARVADLGGHVIIKSASLEDMESYTRTSDLVVVAAGSSQFTGLFARDAKRSPFDRPQRRLLQVYLAGVRPWYEPGRAQTRVIITPGAGEIFMLPFYTKDRQRAHLVLVEAVPDGPFDLARTVASGEEALIVVKTILRHAVPTHYSCFQQAELADERAWLAGAITPAVRQPVGRLPSGAAVLGIGDVTILNDPVGGQGANNATKFAHLLAEQIVEWGDRPFTPAWMVQIFETFWAYSQYVNAFNTGLLQPPAPHQQQILLAASHNPQIALDFLNGFDHPPSLFPWFVEPETAEHYLAERGELVVVAM